VLKCAILRIFAGVSNGIWVEVDRGLFGMGILF